MIGKNALNMLKLKIAFINPPHADWCLGNFAAYYMFQSHYKRFGKNKDKITWLPAPYKYNKYETVEQIYEEVKDADDEYNLLTDMLKSI